MTGPKASPQREHRFGVMITEADTGYTKVCAYCSVRYGEVRDLIGQPRELEMVKCDSCIKKAVVAKTRSTLSKIKTKLYMGVNHGAEEKSIQA